MNTKLQKGVSMKTAMNIHDYVESGIDCSDEHLQKRLEKDAHIWELPSRVDQSQAKASDINVIIATFGKQGIQPSDIPGRIGQFLDNTEIPDYYQAFQILKNAETLFNDLPVNVRRLMDNNPALMESFLSDPQNKELLIKEGILIPKPQIDPDNAPLDKKTFKEAMSKNKTDGNKVS